MLGSHTQLHLAASSMVKCFITYQNSLSLNALNFQKKIKRWHVHFHSECVTS